jgi:CheY-like chemotaxis protein
VVEAAERVEFSREPSSLLGDETVLVVEDDEQVRRLATRTLSALGYRVIEAASGREALLHCDRASEDIALLLTDVVMPEMSGKELVELIAARQPTLKVLYMSGYTENAIARRGVIEPGTHMLPKPFTPEQLGRKVRQMLDNGP